eukprot:865038-Amphidinium_carterae.1
MAAFGTEANQPTSRVRVGCVKRLSFFCRRFQWFLIHVYAGSRVPMQRLQGSECKQHSRHRQFPGSWVANQSSLLKCCQRRTASYGDTSTGTFIRILVQPPLKPLLAVRPDVSTHVSLAGSQHWYSYKMERSPNSRCASPCRVQGTSGPRTASLVEKPVESHRGQQRAEPTAI